MPKRIDVELRARAVRLVTEHAGEYPSETAAVQGVAKQLGVSTETVRRWYAQSKVDSGEHPGSSSDALAQIKRLKSENTRLREDVEILRAATVFFAGELDPRNR